MDCIFCQIAENIIKARVIYQTKYITCFLDNNPINPGHALLIPNKHFICMDDVEEEYLVELCLTSKAIGRILNSKLSANGYNILVANGKIAQQSIKHLHFHIVPRYIGDNLDLWFHGRSGKENDIEVVYKKIVE